MRNYKKEYRNKYKLKNRIKKRIKRAVKIRVIHFFVGLLTGVFVAILSSKDIMPKIFIQPSLKAFNDLLYVFMAFIISMLLSYWIITTLQKRAVFKLKLLFEQNGMARSVLKEYYESEGGRPTGGGLARELYVAFKEFLD